MSAKPLGGLGKGIDALISTDFDKSILNDSHERIQNLFITDITPMNGQPRSYFDQHALEELSQSVRQYGVLQPLIVTKTSTGYSIIAGERRWRAAQLAGLKQVPAIVREPKKQEQLEIALIENVQRVDLSPLETAVAIEKLHQEFNLTYKDIAQRLGKAPATVNNTVRLLQLPEQAVIALQQQKITEGHARAILSLKDYSQKQNELLELILKNDWSVRQAEQYVVGSKQGDVTTNQVVKKMATTSPETERLSEQLKTAVSIKRTAKGGRIEIRFKDDAQLQQLLNTIAARKN